MKDKYVRLPILAREVRNPRSIRLITCDFLMGGEFELGGDLRSGMIHHSQFTAYSDELPTFAHTPRGGGGVGDMDTGSNAVSDRCGSDAIQCIDEFGIIAIHLRRFAHGSQQVVRSDKDGINAGNGEYVFDSFDRFDVLGLDNDESYHLP